MFEVLITKTASSEAVEGSVLLHQASVQALRAGLLLQTHYFVSPYEMPSVRYDVRGIVYGALWGAGVSSYETIVTARSDASRALP